MANYNETDDKEVVDNNQVVEESPDEDDSPVEFDETEEEITEEDVENSENQDKTDSKKQSKAENRKYAEMRKAQREKELKTAYNDGLKAGVGGVNPYTKEKIEDDDDIERYQMMKEIEKRGGDPVDDYFKYMKIFKKEALEKQEEAKKLELQHKKEINDTLDAFRKEYPDVDEIKLLNDKKFNLFAKESITRGEKLSEAYKRYLEMNALIESEIEEKARKMAAKGFSSPGSMSGDGQVNHKSYKDMSDKEIIELRKSLY